MTRIGGEWDNLQGRVIFYARLSGPVKKDIEEIAEEVDDESPCNECPINDTLIAGYLATNPVDFVEKTGGP